MKWVLDTNVLVSALLKIDSIPYQVLMRATEGSFQCVVSPAIIAEYEEVLSRPKLKIDPEKARLLLDLLRESLPVSGKASGRQLSDPKDQPFLDAALEAGATAIVTGNLTDFPADICQPVKALSPREARDILMQAPSVPAKKKARRAKGLK